MKKIAALCCSCFLVSLASAVQIYEPFDYAPGSDLDGQGGWVLTSGTSPKVQAGSLVVPGLMPASGGNSVVFGNGAMDIRRNITNAIGPGDFNGVYWYSLAFKVTDLGTMSTNGGFVVAFSATTQPLNYGGMLHLRKNPFGESYNIGVSRSSQAAEDVVWSPNVYELGQTNFVVCRYATPEQANTETTLWINPDSSTYGTSSAPTPDLVANSGLHPLTVVGQFLLRQGSASEGPGVIVLDQIRVEGGWPHVTPIPLTITAVRNGNNLDMSWGGFQNVFIQQATNLTPPVTWQNLNSDAGIRSYSAPIDSTNKFFRLHAWYVE